MLYVASKHQYVTVSAKTRLVRTSMCIEKIEIYMKLCMIQEKICKFLSGQYSKKEDSNRLKLYTTLFAYSWGVRKSLFHFCSPNGLRVTCICLQCGRRKQNRRRFFNKTTFIHLYTSDCMAKTIPWLICQSMVNIASQIPTL